MKTIQKPKKKFIKSNMTSSVPHENADLKNKRNEFVNKNSEEILNYLYTMASHYVNKSSLHVCSEDLAHEAFVGLLTNNGKSENIGPALLSIIVKRRLQDEYIRLNFHSEYIKHVKENFQSTWQTLNNSNNIEDIEIVELVKEHVNKSFNDRQKKIFDLFFLRQESMNEIEKQMQHTAQNIYYHIKKIIAKLTMFMADKV